MRTKSACLAAVLATLVTGAAFAQITGAVDGTVVDSHGRALSGVTVEATSASLQGNRVAVSDEGGGFHLVFLPPGSYAVRCSLTGYATVERGDIVVPLGRTVTLQVQMQPAFREEVTVSGAAPAIDVRSEEVGANVNREFFLNLPIDRDYVSVVTATPGTTTDGSGTVVYGSTGLENVYYIDGINTSDLYQSSPATTLNFEFIDEVQVKTAGYAAEYGRATGGVVNVITRSGGNAFHGDGFGYYFSDALQSPPSREAETYRRENAGSFLVDRFRKADVGFDLGGFMLKDRLWFFTAYDWVGRDEDHRVTKDFSPYGGPPQGKVYVAAKNSQLWSAKLTWHLGANHSLIASAFGDPARFDGPLPYCGLNGEETTFLGTEDSGGNNAMLRYEGVLGTNLVVDAQVSRFTTGWTVGGRGTTLARVSDLTTPLYYETGVPSVRGGFGGHWDELDSRETARISATFFTAGPVGAHELKLGAEEERAVIDYPWYSAGPTVAIRCAALHLTEVGCPPEWTYYSFGTYLASVPPGGITDPDFASYAANFIELDPRNENQTAFVQDTWQVTPTLTLNLGLRWERQKMFDSHGTLKLDLAGELAPRLGFVWDPRGDGRAKVFGSWGRFYESVPMTLSFNSFNDLVWGLVSTRDLASVRCDPALDADPAFVGCYTVVNSATPVDPSGVKGEFMDEAVLGAEMTTARDLVLGAKLIYRSLDRVVEDSMAPDGYYIGNPGYGLLQTALDMSYSWVLPVPRPRRTFKGVELTARKRLSHNWQMMASYLWSKLEGSYDGNYYADYGTGQLMPNISAAYDYAEFAVHNSGYLSNDHRHQAKVSATYSFPFGLVAGASAYYRSGRPLSAIGYTYAYGSLLYLSERGAWGRTDPEYEIDLHVGYPIKVGGIEANVLLDVFNLLNRQGETGRDQRYNYIDQTIDVIDYSTGKVLPPIAPGTPCTSVVPPEYAYSCNPGFNTANAWQDPRSVRLGVRLTF
jgi:outer membrane receptor protein involved in Fe transport